VSLKYFADDAYSAEDDRALRLKVITFSQGC